MTFVRRATIAAALLAVPVVAALTISTSASAPTVEVAPLADRGVGTAASTSVPNGGFTVNDVRYLTGKGHPKRKKKKATARKKAAAAKITAPAPVPAPVPIAAPAPAPVPVAAPVSEAFNQFSVTEGDVITLTNAQRLANGCGLMHTDSRLTLAAWSHSQDMAARDYFDHSGSDGSTFSTREAETGYPALDGGAENIAWGYPTAQAVVSAWMASPGHRANILDCSNTAVGVGLVKKADGTAYWTQDFGRV